MLKISGGLQRQGSCKMERDPGVRVAIPDAADQPPQQERLAAYVQPNHSASTALRL